ncbi:endonuclease Q family protein [Patescibacteria group bacterium]|nr:endonuclease Q family protein [Patescibacteria group bacterium]MBU1563578.1 endonuclease Q family protein [Patescibacteria group bacterium]MBU2068266.1 endonuclease Q family protein [Patescibacteria group bacterium]
MKFVADLHIHSKYSRATSRDMDIDHLNKWAKIKGIKVLGTGDFTHHLWLKELKEKLEPAEPGLFKLKKKIQITSKKDDWLPDNSNGDDQDQATRFLLSGEISCIYSKNNRVRKIHVIILAPSFKVVEKINTRLGWIGNIKSDGRPILGLDVKELLKIVLTISGDCLIIPAHIYTPWFSLFGANSGFDSIEECFEEYSNYIYAVETGISSDPLMNWRWSALDKITLISNSDSHSPWRIGREANIFDTDLSYQGIADVIKNSSPSKFLETIEFFPEEGRYYYDGHRKCGIVLTPSKSKKIKSICPKCKKPLTIGTLHRIDDLADRNEGYQPDQAIPFRRMIPLDEIIADAKGVGPSTKTVKREYKNLIQNFGTEFEILLNVNLEHIERVSSPEIAEGINRVRQSKVDIDPGYDGEYGQIKIFKDKERGSFSKQASLFRIYIF